MSEPFNVTVKLTNNNVALTKKELDSATERALYAMGIKAVEGSVDAISGRYSIDPAVDTGRLRASISFITPTQKGDSGQPKPNGSEAGDELSGTADKNTVVVGSNVEYAAEVHTGTSRIAGRPFLTEGINQTRDKMYEQVDKIFKGQL